MECIKKPFGVTKNGEAVDAYTLINKDGNSVTILSLGGIIQSVVMPDGNGTLACVVDGLSSVGEYEEISPYFGCITGRIAGRISDAKFTIDGTTYELTKNDGPNNLHGGPIGLDKVVWSVAENIGEAFGELVLSYTSPHMDQGFPGTLAMIVSYRFDDDNTLTISYKATTDEPTILTLTNHTYFNLSGDLTKDILGHELKIPADEVIFVNDQVIPTDRVTTKGTAFDFTSPKAIGRDIGQDDPNLKNAGGYDHAFLLNKEEGETIQLSDPVSRRQLTMTTTEKCVVCYTGNFIDDSLYTFDHQPMKKNGAVCLETQYYPNAINADFFETKILRPGEVYSESTTYHFGIY